MADDAEAASVPNPYLRKQLGVRLKMTEPDRQSLDRVSLAYGKALAPLHTRALALAAEFRARFSDGRLPVGFDASPSPELVTITAKENALVLQFRDVLRNTMSDSSYNSLKVNFTKSRADLQ